jgi:hypothetical protein
MRRLYDIRERSSNMYNWTAMITSQIAIEIPRNILGSSCFFACWYWTVGFDSDSVVVIGYRISHLLYDAQYGYRCNVSACQVASPLFSLFFFFVLGLWVAVLSFLNIFQHAAPYSCGVMQPFNQLGWWKWLYHLSSLTCCGTPKHHLLLAGARDAEPAFRPSMRGLHVDLILVVTSSIRLLQIAAYSVLFGQQTRSCNQFSTWSILIIWETSGLS